MLICVLGIPGSNNSDPGRTMAHHNLGSYNFLGQNLEVRPYIHPLCCTFPRFDFNIFIRWQVMIILETMLGVPRGATMAGGYAWSAPVITLACSFRYLFFCFLFFYLLCYLFVTLPSIYRQFSWTAISTTVSGLDHSVFYLSLFLFICKFCFARVSQRVDFTQIPLVAGAVNNSQPGGDFTMINVRLYNNSNQGMSVYLSSFLFTPLLISQYLRVSSSKKAFFALRVCHAYFHSTKSTSL